MRKSVHSGLAATAVGVASVVIGALSPAFAADMPAVTAAPAEEKRWDILFNTEVRYFSSISNKSNPPVAGTVSRARGDQVYIPYGFELNGRPSEDLKLDYVMRSLHMVTPVDQRRRRDRCRRSVAGPTRVSAAPRPIRAGRACSPTPR